AAIVPLVIVGSYAAAQWMARRLIARGARPARNRTALTATLSLTGVLAIVLGLITIRRLEAYKSELAIWQDAVVHQPHDPLVQFNLGTSLAKVGRPQEAIEHFEEALRLDPDPSHALFSEAHFNLGR